MITTPTESVVYVIGNADNRLVKIGTTSKSKLERLAGIQTMSPSILTVPWTTPSDKELEHKLHYQFRAERRHGEWFDFGDADPMQVVPTAAREIAEAPAVPSQRRESHSDPNATLRQSVEAITNHVGDYGSAPGRAVADGYALVADGVD